MNTSTFIRTLLALSAASVAATAAAKLPPPSDEAKAKAAEAAAKTAHGNKVADYKLCLSMNDVAAKYAAAQKKAGKPVNPTPTPPCADPGPFVYTPPAAAPATATAAAAAPAKPAAPAAAAPAAAPAAPKKS
jgi:hypothetical protein